MAKNKGELDRVEKREEILNVARRLFFDAGYEATSMSRLAEEVGVSPNTIYWYFADKDALLVAVLDALLTAAIREFEQKRRAPLEAQVLWLLSQLEGAESLVVTVHARAAVSATVRQWHDHFHRLVEAILVAELGARGTPAADVPYAARVAMFAVEGLLAHPTSARDRRALIRWLVSRVQTG